ncbi:MAG TPA: thiolase family protein [Acidimicrobiales bacterium]|nr:thiolase family protein [Acidimicrobiales bacterium]
MPEAVIVAACRTAIGTAHKGTLADTSAFDLADTVVREAVNRSGIDPSRFDDIVLGESLYGGGDIARHAAVTAGLTGVPGLALNRHCASGLSSVQTAAANVKAGMMEAVVAGGVQSSSTGPVSRWRRPGTDEWDERFISPSHPDTPDAPNLDMSITVGWNSAIAAGVSREDMDAWALGSHRKAVAAIDAGRLVEEIVPIEVSRRDGTQVTFAVDEHPRRDTSMEKLAALKPLHPEIEGFSITPGNASGINDGAAALVLTSDRVASAEGREVLGTVRAWASVGVEPRDTGLAPVQAIPKALKLAGLDLADVALFEINEAFASMCVATTRLLGIDPALVNPSGSGCSLGHPVAATGARMLTSLLYELRRRGGGIGVASMCAGGGMGSAVVIEV